VDELRAGPLAIMPVVGRVVAVARQQIEEVSNLVADQVDVLGATLTAVRTTLTGELDAFAGKVGGFVVGLFTEHWTVKVFKAFRDQLTAFMTAYKATPPPPKKPGDDEPGFLDPLVAALPPAPPIRTFPDVPTFNPDDVRRRLGAASVPPLDIQSIVRAAEDSGRAGFEAPVELSAQARAAVARMGRRHSVFGADRRAIADELAGSPEKAFLTVQELERFRQAFAVIVGRVLPPELRATAIPKLVDPAELPVLDLPTSDELRPVVRKLRLRMPGANVNDVKRFQDLVTERIQQRSYRVAPESGGR
jgi:hypothetical protein